MLQQLTHHGKEFAIEIMAGRMAGGISLEDKILIHELEAGNHVGCGPALKGSRGGQDQIIS